jgi:hypothetical protein
MSKFAKMANYWTHAIRIVLGDEVPSQWGRRRWLIEAVFADPVPESIAGDTEKLGGFDLI